MTKTSILKTVDAVAGSILCRLCGRLPSVAANHEHAHLPVPDDVRTILVIRPGGMGDMIVLLPILRALQNHFKNARIDLACERRNLGVVHLSGLPCRALAYDVRPLAFLRALHRHTYDIAIDTEQFHNFSALFAFFSGAPVRIGFKINPRRNPLYTHLINYSLDGPEGEQFLRLLAPLGIVNQPYSPVGALRDADTSLSPEHNAELDRFCAGRPPAILHIGASTPYKRWDPARFAALARGLRDRKGLATILIGTPDGAGAARRVVREAGDAAGIANFVGRLDLNETAALMKRATLFVGGDSGMAHLAVAFGLPTVVLFGPSDHLKWGTRDETHQIVRTPLPCSPCFIFGYHKPCRSIACMASIDVQEVLDACERVTTLPAAAEQILRLLPY